MEKYIRKLQHLKHHSRGHYRQDNGDMSRYVKKFKKIIVIAVAVIVLSVIAFIVLIVMAFNWLFNRGGEEISKAGSNVVQQVQPDVVPLDLASYVSGAAVNTEQLEQTFNALPSQLQGLWLDQFKAQLYDLRSQAGISDQTVQTLTDLYNTFQLTQ
jgi:predicted PurR-regulated permease PerM